MGYLFGGPYDKDYSILGSILGVPLFSETTISQKQPWTQAEAVIFASFDRKSVHDMGRGLNCFTGLCRRLHMQYRGVL